ncbi:hypothetical protein CF336_g7269 [Tilletia laevis]|nr:hypothetical protein CF336_g7269 [Tilletia laevis]
MPAQRVIPHAPNRSWGVNNIIGYRISPTTHEEEPLCEWDNTYIAYGKFSNPDQARRDVAAIKRRRRSSPPHPNSDLPPPPGQALPVPLSDPTPNPPLRSTLPCRPPPPPSDPAPDTPICSTSLCRPPLSPNPPALPLRPLHMLPPRPKHRGKRGGGLEHQQRSQDILKKMQVNPSPARARSESFGPPPPLPYFAKKLLSPAATMSPAAASLGILGPTESNDSLSASAPGPPSLHPTTGSRPLLPARSKRPSG